MGLGQISSMHMKKLHIATVEDKACVPYFNFYSPKQAFAVRLWGASGLSDYGRKRG